MAFLRNFARALVEAHDAREQERAQQQKVKVQERNERAERDYQLTLRETGQEDSKLLRTCFDRGRESAFDEALRMAREK